MSSSSRKSSLLGVVVGVLLAAVAILAVVLWPQGKGGSSGSTATAPPTGPAHTPTQSVPTFGETPAPTAAATDVAAAGTPSVVGEADTTPVPSPVPAADPMAEFRVAPFTGLVLDGTSYQPIEGARVKAYVFRHDAFEMRSGYPIELGETTSDAKGFFQFQPQEFERSETLAWRAEADGFGNQIFLYPGGDGQGDKLRTTFLLKPFDSIAGVVVDQDDEPIANATIGALVLNQTPLVLAGGAPPALPSAYATSDAKGAFTLEGLEAGKSYALPAKADGFAPVRTESIAAGIATAKIVLSRADTKLRGRVLDSEGGGASAVRVEVVWLGPNTSPRVVDTDGDGYFELPDLSAGRYTVEATPSLEHSFGPGARVSKDVTLVKGREGYVELQLPARATLKGRFVEEEGGKGVAGVKLFPLIEDAIEREKAGSIETDKDGEFEIEASVADVPYGEEVRLPIELPEGYFPMGPSRREGLFYIEQGYASFTGVRPGDEREGTFRISTGVKLTGVVIEPDTKSPGRELPVFFTGNTYNADVMTDAQGRFEAFVPAGERLKIECSSDRGIANTFIEMDRDKSVTLQLLAYASISGAVSEVAGPAIADMPVVITRPAVESSYREGLRFPERGLSGEGGVYTIANVAPGVIDIVCEPAPSQGYAPVRPVRITLEPGEERTGVDLELDPGDRLRGTVVDASNQRPIGGATVVTTMSTISANTDSRGNFELVGIPPETPLDGITVTAQGYADQTRENVSVYDGDLRFELEPLGGLELTVEDSSGASVPAFRVRLMREASSPRGTVMEVVREEDATDGRGVLLIGDLARGRYRAEASELGDSGPTGRGGTLDIDFAPTSGPPQRETITLEGDLALTGRTVDAGGVPVPNTTVELMNPPASLLGDNSSGPGHPVYRTTTDAAGSFRIQPIPSGTYKLRAFGDGTSSLVTEATVEPGTGGSVELELVKSPRVFGVVVGEDGEPVDSATMYFLPNGGPPDGDALKAPGGQYERYLPQAGLWTIVANEDGTPNNAMRDVTLAVGEEREVNFDLSARITLRGMITLNGAAAPRSTALILRTSAGEETVVVPGAMGDGSFEVRIPPGSHEVMLAGQMANLPTGDVAVVAPSPTEQQRNFDIRTGTIDIVVASLSGDLTGLKMTLEASVGGAPRPVMSNQTVTKESVRLFNVPVGAYRVVIHRGEEEVGASTLQSVAPGASAQLVVEVP